MDLEKVVANLAQKVEHRFYGKYRAFVVDNADPEHLGRLKLKVPSVLGDEVVTGWAMPCTPYGGDANQGFLFVPEIDAGVWVEFEEGDLEFPIWVGTFWSKPGGESELPKPNDPDGTEQGSVQDPPTRKIIKTVKGHTIQLEDADGEERIIICDGEGENQVTLSKSGVTIAYKDNSITMTDQGIIIEDANSNTVTQDSSGIIIEDASGNKITMDATSGFPSGPGVTVNGSKRVCLDGLVDWLLQHQHVGNMGAPTPLFPANMVDLIASKAGTPNGILSTKIKVE
ncbi:MAG: phage baseplate assembly protein V [Planctomycetota bacterium]